MEVNYIAIAVALLGAGGLGGVVTSIVNSVMMARKGVAGKEDKRRDDIIAQRDAAYARAEKAEAEADKADARADRERINRIRWMEHAAKLRIQLIRAGLDPADTAPNELTGP